MESLEVVRVLSLNLWGEQPPVERRLAIAIEGFRALAPDVIALQEVREVPVPIDPSPLLSPMPNMAETIARALGFHFVFAPATPWGGGVEGLAIVSRFPIARTAHEALPHAIPTETRLILGATLDTPRGPLSVFTTHLNYRLTDGGKREDQVAAADAFIQSWPSPLPKILMGDFNAVPHSDEIRFLRGLHSHAGRRTYFQDAWERVHPDDRGYTWARRNHYTSRLGWLEPDRRLDYIFVSPMRKDGVGVIRDCRIVLDDRTADGHFASDHFGLMAEVQVAPGQLD